MIPTTSKLIDNNGVPFGIKHIDGKPRTSSMPYLYDIAEGNVPDHHAVRKFGHNSAVGATLEEVWDGADVYTYASSAESLYLSSSAAGDDQIYEIQGLDANWDYQIVRATANGFNSVAISGTWMRVFRIKNLGTTDNAGIIYVSTDADAGGDGVPDGHPGDTRAQVSIGYNQTLMALWSVPRSFKAYLTSFYASTSSTKATEVHLYVRPFGGVFQIKKVITIYEGSERMVYDFPLNIDAKSDVSIKALASGGGGEVSAGFDLWYEKE
jgi:hypothetical protein